MRQQPALGLRWSKDFLLVTGCLLAHVVRAHKPARRRARSSAAGTSSRDEAAPLTPVRGAGHTEGRPARPTVAAAASAFGGVLYPPAERSQIRDSWRHLMRWSRRWRTCDDSACVLDNLEKVRIECFSVLDNLDKVREGFFGCAE